MIKNEHQYRITSKLAKKLGDSMAALAKNSQFKAMQPRAQAAYTSSLNAQLSQFNKEIKEYETLRAGKFDFKRLPSLEQIPAWLIQARIAKGMRQEDLAKLLNLKKQQIQNYEATNYAAVSLSRIMKIVEALRR